MILKSVAATRIEYGGSIDIELFTIGSRILGKQTQRIACLKA